MKTAEPMLQGAPPGAPASPWTLVRRAWRWLRTMRTAIILLLLLAAGAAVGSLFPQRPIQPDKVLLWKRVNPGWAPFAEKLGLFDVYGSWWFMLIYGLLLVSLIGCLFPRYRAFWRVMRSKPRTGVTMETQQRYRAGTAGVDEDRALSGAERILRKRRFRLVRAGGTVAAEKGRWREGGSLIFHTAFLVLLLGMSIGKLFGSTGQVALVEGDRFTDTHVDYDFISEGRFFNEHFRGFEVALDRFDVDWYPNGVPKQFASSVRLFDRGRFVRNETIIVNHPMTYRGVRIYQLSWGWAPDIVVRQNGKVLYAGPTVFLSQKGAWHGVVKLPSARPNQSGLDMLFFADPVVRNGGPVDQSPRPNHPVLVYQQYQGDLALDVPQSVYELNTTDMHAAGSGVIPMGQTVSLGNGMQVSFRGLRQYSVFQVNTNPGAPILLIAAVLILVGLLPALYSSRRRVWVRAAPQDGPQGATVRLEIAGHALQRKAAFEEEFESLVRDLEQDLQRTSG